VAPHRETAEGSSLQQVYQTLENRNMVTKTLSLATPTKPL
jgi:hypothetical protein